MLAMIRAKRIGYPRFIFCEVCGCPVRNLTELVEHALSHFKHIEANHEQAQRIN